MHISPGPHECGESGRAIGRVQAFSFVAFKVQQVYDSVCRSERPAGDKRDEVRQKQNRACSGGGIGVTLKYAFKPHAFRVQRGCCEEHTFNHHGMFVVKCVCPRLTVSTPPPTAARFDLKAGYQLI